MNDEREGGEDGGEISVEIRLGEWVVQNEQVWDRERYKKQGDGVGKENESYTCRHRVARECSSADTITLLRLHADLPAHSLTLIIQLANELFREHIVVWKSISRIVWVCSTPLLHLTP